MLSACDINHDGQITYDEFVKFCKETERSLWNLFQSIDRDHNGNLDKSELSQAFERAGVSVSNARLDRFFGYIDKDHDGKINFPEWRGMSSSPFRVGTILESTLVLYGAEDSTHSLIVVHL